MTKEERETELSLKKEAKKLQEEDASGGFLYLVRGLPWERRVVKIRKSLAVVQSAEATLLPAYDRIQRPDERNYKCKYCICSQM